MNAPFAAPSKAATMRTMAAIGLSCSATRRMCLN